MTDHAVAAPPAGRSLTSYIYDPKFRGLFFQALTLVITIFVGWWIFDNTTENLARSNTASGYQFLKGRAGFDIGQSLIPYTSDSTYGRAIFVGFLNTLLVAAVGIVTATIIGFLIGIGRLSRNWLIAKLCTIYVEVFRNIPVLLVIFFFYKGVLGALPQVRDSLELPFSMFLNNRGLAFPGRYGEIAPPSSRLPSSSQSLPLLSSRDGRRRAKQRPDNHSTPSGPPQR
jgi:general L-amino acid transport system permease protein